MYELQNMNWLFYKTGQKYENKSRYQQNTLDVRLQDLLLPSKLINNTKVTSQCEEKNE